MNGHLDDKLQNNIDWDAIMPMDRYAGGHDDQMKGLLKGAEVLAHWNEGGWDGQVATAVKLADGRYACYSDYYGSCSGCDYWEDASDEDVRALCIGLANSARVFYSLADMIAWLGRDDHDYEWSLSASNLLGMLKEKGN